MKSRALIYSKIHSSNYSLQRKWPSLSTTAGHKYTLLGLCHSSTALSFAPKCQVEWSCRALLNFLCMILSLVVSLRFPAPINSHGRKKLGNHGEDESTAWETKSFSENVSQWCGTKLINGPNKNTTKTFLPTTVCFGIIGSQKPVTIKSFWIFQ